MATNHTSNYQLNLWEPGDAFVREEFNENTQKVDAALKAETNARTAADAALQTAVAAKADASTVTALQTAVNGKASAAALNALTQQVAQGANCRVVTGTYVGTGGHGDPIFNSLTFPGNPFFLAVVGDACFWALSPEKKAAVSASNGTFFEIYLTWSEKAVSWTGISQDFLQLNTKGRTYHYIALIEV